MRPGLSVVRRRGDGVVISHPAGDVLIEVERFERFGGVRLRVIAPPSVTITRTEELTDADEGEAGEGTVEGRPGEAHPDPQDRR